MMLSDLPSPAEAGFAKAGNHFTPRIKSGAGFFGIMLFSLSMMLSEKPLHTFRHHALAGARSRGATLSEKATALLMNPPPSTR
ncbi:MAG: hypothetical protein K8F62_11085, partial [Pseudorhodoplanes sp.]|nr:hypothetical protein [Pseudorhodoplanes sp.]